MGRIKKVVGSYLLGLAAMTAGCRGFTTLESEVVDIASLQSNAYDNHVSIDEVIAEAKKYGPSDRMAKEISNIAVAGLEEISGLASQGGYAGTSANTDQVSAETRRLVGILQKYDHPFVGLLKSEIGDMSYLYTERWTTKKNVLAIRGFKKWFEPVLYFLLFGIGPIYDTVYLPRNLLNLYFWEGKEKCPDTTEIIPQICIKLEDGGSQNRKIHFYPFSGRKEEVEDVRR